YLLSEKRFHLSEVSPTFHGRDIFAPVAGHLTLGISPEAFGKRIDSWKSLKFPSPLFRKRSLKGKVIHIDSFGNLITNIDRKKFIQFIRNRPFLIQVGKKKIKDLKKGYWEGKKGETIALFGSMGFLEISVREGNAQKRLNIEKGEQISVYLRSLRMDR
ncbi:MAG: SAM hydrolase/SAM-dependent halogenase family protein, partial [Thermodesulfobacteriota bacterium]